MQTGIWFEDAEEDHVEVTQEMIDMNESCLVKNIICYNDEGR